MGALAGREVCPDAAFGRSFEPAIAAHGRARQSGSRTSRTISESKSANGWSPRKYPGLYVSSGSTTTRKGNDGSSATPHRDTAESLTLPELLSVAKKRPLEAGADPHLKKWIPSGAAPLAEGRRSVSIELALSIVDVWDVLADPTDLELAIMNTAVNARRRDACARTNIRDSLPEQYGWSAAMDPCCPSGRYVPDRRCSDDGLKKACRKIRSARRAAAACPCSRPN